MAHLWDFRRAQFPAGSPLFDPGHAAPSSPPVFLEAHADENVLGRADASEEERQAVLATLDPRRRHRWFRSMRSSQALTQSVFGHLAILTKLHLLANLAADDDDGVAFFTGPSTPRLRLDHEVSHLNEPRPTSVDVFLEGDRRVAVECKFAETAVGPCSRPRLPRQHPRHCNGTYSHQGHRQHRCSLSESGVRYWDYVPKLFRWGDDVDHDPCPLNQTYQLVRNLLAACVSSDGRLNPTHHALLLYDDRNPAFQPGGAGVSAYHTAKQALREVRMLRRCSWQRVLGRLASDRQLGWLTQALAAKYRLVASTESGA